MFLNLCLNNCVVSASWLDPDGNISRVTQPSKQKDESEKSGRPIESMPDNSVCAWILQLAVEVLTEPCPALDKGSKAREVPQEGTACAAAFLF